MAAARLTIVLHWSLSHSRSALWFFSLCARRSSFCWLGFGWLGVGGAPPPAASANAPARPFCAAVLPSGRPGPALGLAAAAATASETWRRLFLFGSGAGVSGTAGPPGGATCSRGRLALAAAACRAACARWSTHGVKPSRSAGCQCSPLMLMSKCTYRAQQCPCETRNSIRHGTFPHTQLSGFWLAKAREGALTDVPQRSSTANSTDEQHRRLVVASRTLSSRKSTAV